MPSLEGLPTKAEEDPSPHEMRLSPAGHQPNISWSQGIIMIMIIITFTATVTAIATTTTITIIFMNLMKSAPILQFTRAYILKPKILFCSKFQLKSLILLPIFVT